MLENQDTLGVSLNIIKAIFDILCIFFTNYKISNQKLKLNIDCIIKIICAFVCSIIYGIMKYRVNYLVRLIFSILSISIIFSKNNIYSGLVTTIISFAINSIILFICIIISFCISFIFQFNSDVIYLIVILICHLLLLTIFFHIKKFKYGFSFLNKSKEHEYEDIFILNISLMILTFIMIIVNIDLSNMTRNLFFILIMMIIIMLITIQKSLKLFYKQKMLIKDLTETKEELENKKKEITELEAENIRISKKNHTIVHKQKSIEHKLEEMLTKTEISAEEAGEVKERLEKLHNQIYSEKENTELDKTGISNIDDMLKYMQSECIENKIEFTLVLKGNIHYMVNNLIPKEDLETLIADHIKDAIIAVNHTDNINRSILVKLGDIDGIYSLQIYDSGVEFKKEVLENLGKKPFTTYKNEGGTGMGFMNTFDTLRKCKASLTIEEFNKPCIDNYTKAIVIRFNGKSNFNVKSYRDIKIDYKISK